MNKANVAKCPRCGRELEYENFFFEEDSIDFVWFSATGRCPECGKNFTWEDKFAFAGSYSIEEAN